MNVMRPAATSLRPVREALRLTLDIRRWTKHLFVAVRRLTLDQVCDRQVVG